jgi:hypothetical protein
VSVLCCQMERSVLEKDEPQCNFSLNCYISGVALSIENSRVRNYLRGFHITVALLGNVVSGCGEVLS